MYSSNHQTAIIIGAGPAGLTAAYELLARTEIVPTIIEMTPEIGGISRTVKYKGNRIDIGGHRFFSKSQRVMDWWKIFMHFEQHPFQEVADDVNIPTEVGNEVVTDNVMLLRRRVSRILYLQKFFDYPIKVNIKTARNLGLVKIIRIGYGYLQIKLSPTREEKNLEDFFINRFGTDLYKTFFKDYTEKVWGISCREISPEWGGQRVKGLSIRKALVHAISLLFAKDTSIEQKKVETSLIDKFLYPKLGPGQLWENVAAEINKRGGNIIENTTVLGIRWHSEDRITVITKNESTGEKAEYSGAFLFSTMPVKDLISSMFNAPSQIRKIAEGLVYRDFITVGVLVDRILLINDGKKKDSGDLIPDNWIYIQETTVKLGRLQIFNNWSPFLLNDKSKVWLGLEYFCKENDSMWMMSDDEMIRFATKELEEIKIIKSESVLDATVIRVPKAYPAYFGTYNEIDKIKDYVNQFPNLFLIGRNGMHKYNNQDHSMLTAMIAVDNILNQITDKSNIWEVNTEDNYHEKMESNKGSVEN